MPSQTASSILLIRPAAFGFNTETASTNTFQQSSSVQSVESVALAEFDHFAHVLKSAKVNVIVIDDTAQPLKPDAIFPNNWLSFHEEGKIVLYPMLAPNRREERRQEVVAKLKNDFRFSEIIDLSYFENENRFLEGTGSMVLDRVNRIAYAAISARTHEEVLNVFCEKMNYTPVTFHTKEMKGAPVYHTNVMMSVGADFAVICSDIISNKNEQEKVIASLKNSGKKIIEITVEQMGHFAGNMLQVKNTEGKNILVMSKQAHQSLTISQLSIIQKHTAILVADISTVERIGGGSVRCMMAEIFTPK